jgi:hypothetical protein
MKKLSNIFKIITFLSVCFVGTISESFAQNGVITGTAPKVNKFLAGTTRAYSLGTAAVYGRDLSAKRSYQLSVPEGGYVVISDVIGRREKVSKLDVVSVKKGKKTTIKARAVLSNSTPSTRVSVGNVLLKTPDGKTIKATNGRNITIDDLLIVDLLNSKNDCNFAIVEDRKFGRFKDVLKEIRLQSSKLSANKIDFKSAIATLNANAPQYRISGSVEVNQQQDLTGNASLQIIKIETGEVVWQKSFTNGGTDLGNFSEPLAQAAADAICIPQEVSGTFSGVQKTTGSNLAVTFSWTGSATFKFQSYLAEDPSKPEEYTAALYQFKSGEISSYSASGRTNGCSVSGEAFSLQPEFPSTGALLVYLNPTPGLGYKYSLAVTLLKADSIQITTACSNGSDTRSDVATAELSVSNSEEDLPTTLSLSNYSGSAKILDTDMTWNFKSGL